VLQIAILASLPFSLTAAKKIGGSQLVKAEDMKEFLTTISSDEYEGRATFTEGLGLAAGYIADHLRSWGVKPGGDSGSYYQRVRVLGVKTQNRTTVTVQANGQTRTFKNGEGITIPANAGGKRTVTSDQIEFMGYGLDAPGAKYSDFAGRDVKGRVVVFFGSAGPKALDQSYRRLLTGRARYAIDQKGAIATMGPSFLPSGGRGGQAATPAAGGQPGTPAPGQQGTPQPGQPAGGFGFGGPQIERADFATVQRLDAPIPPAISAGDEFFEFLFSGQEVPYAQLKAKAADREALPVFTLKNVKITFYLIGSDRISTELHNLSVDANQALSKPLKLDFEMNDPSDLEQFYYRSDHYSYAAKGIPIVFLTTGLHPDYHANTDSAEKINYEKMGRIGQLAYLLGQRVANLDHPPARDNRGARAGKGTTGKLE
jgi:hypothetical protein